MGRRSWSYWSQVFCSDSFLPPGELADFFGFQYHRDNDQSAMGHSGDYLTGAANNVLYILSTDQKAELVTLAKNQVSLINEYACEPFPSSSMAQAVPESEPLRSSTIVKRP